LFPDASLGASEIPLCELVTATIAMQPGCSPPPVDLIVVVPTEANEPEWIRREASATLAVLLPGRWSVSFAVVEYDERSAGIVLPWTQQVEEVVPAISQARKAHWLGGDLAEPARRVAQLMRGREPQITVVVLFGDIKGGQPELEESARTAARIVGDAGARLIVGCSGHRERANCTYLRPMVASADYSEFPDRGVLANRLGDVLTEASIGLEPVQWSLSVTVPHGLEVVPRSIEPPPSAQVDDPGGSTIAWRGTVPVSTTMLVARSVFTTNDGQMNVETADPVTVTVSGDACAVPSATPTATRVATPHPRPGRIYLPVLLKEHCSPDPSHADAVLVIDASTSMLEDVRAGYTKRDAATDAARRFVDLMTTGDQAAIVWFNERAGLEQELTGDKAALGSALNRIVNREFTRIDLGIKVAREELATHRHLPGNRPVVIVLTDGKANPEPIETALGEAVLAKDAGATLFVIGLADPQELDDHALRLMASRPEYYFRTTDPAVLVSIYEGISGVIPCPPEHFWGRRRSLPLPGRRPEPMKEALHTRARGTSLIHLS
jgi:Mg-chelatase subunit ChlD